MASTSIMNTNNPPSLAGSEILDKENSAPVEPIVKDGQYFLQVVQKKKIKIENMISKASGQLKEFDQNQSSDEAGKMRVAIGKAKLLINKKFKQFEDLCEANLLEQSTGCGSSGEPFTTKNDDLAGFWDMVLIQVAQVYEMFRDCGPDSQKKKTEESTASPCSKITPKRKVTKKAPADPQTKRTPVPVAKLMTKTSKPSPLRDELRRKILEDKKKALKDKAAGVKASTSELDVKIFSPNDKVASQAKTTMKEPSSKP